MPPQRKPVAVLRAGGSRHYSKAELAARESREIKVQTTKKVTPPDYLPDGLKKKFRSLAKPLVESGLMTYLDRDTLARYLIAEQNYLLQTQRLGKAMAAGDADRAAKYATMQDKSFKQCRAAAHDLGLTVSSRCRLETPKGMQEPQEADDLFGS